MKEIPIKILNAHNMVSLEQYKEMFGDTLDIKKTFYQTFLIQTDYICNEIVEGVSTWEDYAEEKVARAFAREQLSTLEEIVEEKINEEVEETKE